jgi:hypothetical protein
MEKVAKVITCTKEIQQYLKWFKIAHILRMNYPKESCPLERTVGHFFKKQNTFNFTLSMVRLISK